MSEQGRLEKGPPTATASAAREILGASGERLFDAKRGRLLGCRCARCGTVYFPRRAICPDCFTAGTMAEHALSRTGVVYASTVVRVASSLGHKPPYSYGYVDLPRDGVRVFARFVGALERFVPGAAVELATETVSCGEAGDLLAWAFCLTEAR